MLELTQHQQFHLRFFFIPFFPVHSLNNNIRMLKNKQYSYNITQTRSYSEQEVDPFCILTVSHPILEKSTCLSAELAPQLASSNLIVVQSVASLRGRNFTPWQDMLEACIRGAAECAAPVAAKTLVDVLRKGKCVVVWVNEPRLWDPPQVWPSDVLVGLPLPSCPASKRYLLLSNSISKLHSLFCQSLCTTFCYIAKKSTCNFSH